MTIKQFVLLGTFPCLGAPMVNAIAPTSVRLGSAFTVTVNVEDVSDLYAYQFDLGFDPTLFVVSAADPGDFLQSAGETFKTPAVVDSGAGRSWETSLARLDRDRCSYCSFKPGKQGRQPLRRLVQSFWTRA